MKYSQNLNKILEGSLNTQETDQLVPKLYSNRIGIISRDYRETSGISDFNDCLEEVLNYCDSRDCDTILFSLFTVLETHFAEVKTKFKQLKHIKSLFIEEFSIKDGKRYAGNYHCLFKLNEKWNDYVFFQKFATVLYTKEFEYQVIHPFIEEMATKRLLGSLTVLLCGETNSVKYDKDKKVVIDHFGLLNAIPSEVKIILNPVHDRMTRFEMKLKRAFLSNNNRLVISVWNKGKTDNKGINRDGKNPPWTIYSNGQEIYLKRELVGDLGFPKKGLEIGILDISTLLAQK